ncbi:MAG: YlxR family protein [Lachnospiraceae bacterium]|nr:YlxR family protein [Lachnospiraceae bacterium]
MINKKSPSRMCVGCGEMKEKKQMIRVIKTPEHEIVLDVTGKKNGRGAYICRSVACLQKAIKSKMLEKSLRTAIPDSIYEALEKELKELEK